jgi:Domain of unknown function (DUF1772)
MQLSRFVLYFVCLLFTALALVPAAAHVMELPNKIKLPKAEYLVAQQLYRGWQFVGLVVVAALLSTFALTISLSDQAKPFVAALVACLCIAATQAVFWIFTFPVNRATTNWSVLPANWVQLRNRWEYSHAASAVLNLVAFVAVIIAVLWASNA